MTERAGSALLDGLPDPLFALDAAGVVLDLNRAAAARVGASKEEARGRLFWEFFPDLQGTAFEDALLRVATTGRAARIEETETDADRWTEARLFPTPDGIGVVLRDISVEKQVEAALLEQEQLLETIFEEAPIGIGFWDADLRFRRLNRTLAAMNGLPVDAHLGKTVAELLPGVPREVTEAFARVAATSKHLSHEVSGHTPAAPGRRRTWRASYFPVRRPNGRAGVAAICEEITDRREAELERERLMGVLGHDLKNPLAAILMSIDRLSDRVASEDRPAVERIRRAGARMQRMIRDLLDFTVIRHGGGLPVSPVPTDLAALCRDVVAEIQQAHPRRIIQVTGDDALAGIWDPERLAQVLSNVLGNAIQHSPDGAPVALDVSRAEEGEGAVVRVWNAGAPIPSALLATVFDPFRQGSAQRSRESVGLGLFIAQQIVAAHGGAISIESAEATGTTVSIRIPVTER